MGKLRLILLNFIFLLGVNAQDVELPADFRQHNLTMFNASLMDPTFALDTNWLQSIALWTRWQWQSIDTDPTTTLLNYTNSVNDNSVIGAGFMQHNSGVYLQTGGILNYVHAFDLSENAKLAIGVNVLGFQREIADDRFFSTDGVNIPNSDTNDFIMQLAPGIRLLLNRFSLSFTSENFVDINFSSNSNDSNNKKKVFLGAMAYNFPIQLIGIKEETYLRPMFYLKSIPQMETQLGLNALLSSQKFWVQGGYNNFYGASAGVGGIFFESLSIGVLMEFGLDQGVKEMDPTFELITAIRFGNKKETELLPQEIIISQELKDEQEKVTIKNDDKVIEVQKQETTPKAKLDSIKTVKAEKEEIVKAKPPLESKTITKGKYEEVEQLKGLQPGYYLIANVYGTKKYFDNFMETLRKKGIEPKSFYRSLNKFNYVYLDSYSSLNAAEKARDSKFYGRYADATWIFRVISE
ncbi:PorP/SprF family type IX secretion system membrane protein [Sediminicola arcticus]|jgi:type IX secretion system PorP/SprF family membrane protein|uniref:PorP/SprF family type IX secretion system membrane protein n=1 Tax=Sediminicola arcticus TaxID=1574308 RepID=A0ABV2ST95_9FLAO